MKTRTPKQKTSRRYESVEELVGADNEKHVFERLKQLREETSLVQELTLMRIRAGLTQVQLAAKLGCTQGRISKIESSRDEDLTVFTLQQYAKATGSNLCLDFGAPLNHVDAIKSHGSAMRARLQALATLSHRCDELEPRVRAFFDKAFSDLISIASECAAHLSTRKVSASSGMQILRLSATAMTASSAPKRPKPRGAKVALQKRPK